jgi:hypothetical protein
MTGHCAAAAQVADFDRSLALVTNDDRVDADALGEGMIHHASILAIALQFPTCPSKGSNALDAETDRDRFT